MAETWDALARVEAPDSTPVAACSGVAVLKQFAGELCRAAVERSALGWRRPRAPPSKVGAGRCGDPGGKGGRIQFVIGDQHEAAIKRAHLYGRRLPTVPRGEKAFRERPVRLQG